MKPSLICLLLLLFSSLQADPWGKDADLCHSTPLPSVKTCNTPLLGSLSENMIYFHQKVISCADGPRSHYFPSSSQYTLDSMRKYGFFHGFALGCDRLMRENSDPWVYRNIIGPEGTRLKQDPVR